jgi:hypothetical protein
MKQIFKKLIAYITILSVVFYLIPITTKMETPMELAFTLMIVLNPIACLGTGAVFGIKHGFKLYFLMLAPLLFIPSMYIFYNSSAFIYIVIYIVFSAAGIGIGCVLRKISMK